MGFDVKGGGNSFSYSQGKFEGNLGGVGFQGHVGGHHHHHQQQWSNPNRNAAAFQKGKFDEEHGVPPQTKFATAQAKEAYFAGRNDAHGAMTGMAQQQPMMAMTQPVMMQTCFAKCASPNDFLMQSQSMFGKGFNMSDLHIQTPNFKLDFHSETRSF